MTKSLHDQVREQLAKELAVRSASTQPEQLVQALRYLAKWRSVIIQNTVLKHCGVLVQSGPFSGMTFLEQSSEGCHVAKLLGCYEEPLHPLIQHLVHQPYHTVLNIGCAEGFYAVGMARCMPKVRVHAFDTNPQAQRTCGELARRNGCEDRIQIAGEFTRADFERYKRLTPSRSAPIATNPAAGRTLLLCDIESAEFELLDPQEAPALYEIDILVESHECLKPGVTQALMKRFASSHQIQCIEDNGQRGATRLPAWFSQLSHLDQLLAVWEWRSGPTPWLWMRALTVD
jgi:predicted O-methyltransferase YrrM